MLRAFLRRFFSVIHAEKVRFLVIGLWNTGFGFLLFGAFLFAVGEGLYWLALIFSHLVSSSLAFVLYRRWVFRVTGFVALDFFRFQMVYSATFLINGALLVLLVSAGGLPALIAQAICQLLLLLANFLGHKYFSFARPDVVRG